MKIFLISNTAWSLFNFRSGIILGLMAAGHEVVAVAPSDDYAGRLSSLGCQYIPMPMDNQGTHPGRDLLLWRFYRLLRRERPGAVLGYTVKPNVYGSLAAHSLGIPVVNNIAGLGVVFIKHGWLTRLVRMLYGLALATFFGTMQPLLVAAGSNDIVEKSYIQFPTNTNPRIQAAKSTDYDYISVKDFGAKCDGVTDDAPAVQKAVNNAPRILFPKGTCLLNSTVTLKAGTALRGQGMKVSIVKQGSVNGTSIGTFYANSGVAGSKLAGIQIADMTIDGQSDVVGFSQFQHLVSLNGVKDILIEKVEFRGFRGDGLYIGSGIKGGEERHNENITVKNSVFDGVNHSNRNGISIIDGSGVLIESNKFINTTQSNMPGAIDVEPNVHSFHVVKNITIRNNKLSSIGGAVGAISFVFNSRLAEMPTMLRVEGNSVSETTNGIVYLNRVRPTATSVPNHLIIANNVITTSGRSFDIRGAKEFKIYGNVFSDSNAASLIGYRTESDRCMNGVISDNVFKSFKNDGLVVFSADYLEISRNYFIDIGSKAAGNYASDFNFGISSYIRLRDNIITAILGKTAYAIQKEAGHTSTPSTNSASNNKFIDVLGNAF